MPSFGEILIVSGVAVGTGVDVTSGVDVTGICVGVFSTSSVAVGGGGAAVLWQDARIKNVRRNGMIFFMGIYFCNRWQLLLK